MPSKLVLNTLSVSYFEASIAGSAQQSIIRLNLGNDLIFFKFTILTLKFLIFFLSSLFLLTDDPLRERLSRL